jgi:hypothetical protein
MPAVMAGNHGTGFVPWAFCAGEFTKPRHRDDGVATNYNKILSLRETADIK